MKDNNFPIVAQYGMANYNNNNNEELLGNDEEIREKARIKIFPMEPLIFF